jgi:hypothetical protein
VTVSVGGGEAVAVAVGLSANVAVGAPVVAVAVGVLETDVAAIVAVAAAVEIAVEVAEATVGVADILDPLPSPQPLASNPAKHPRTATQVARAAARLDRAEPRIRPPSPALADATEKRRPRAMPHREHPPSGRCGSTSAAGVNSPPRQDVC